MTRRLLSFACVTLALGAGVLAVPGSASAAPAEHWDFSQFDHDNMARFQVAAYIEAANRLAAEALAGPRPGRAYALAAEGAEEAGVDVERSVRRALRAARTSPVPHNDEAEGASVDTLEPGDQRLLP